MWLIHQGSRKGVVCVYKASTRSTGARARSTYVALVGWKRKKGTRREEKQRKRKIKKRKRERDGNTETKKKHVSRILINCFGGIYQSLSVVRRIANELRRIDWMYRTMCRRKSRTLQGRGKRPRCITKKYITYLCRESISACLNYAQSWQKKNRSDLHDRVNNSLKLRKRERPPTLHRNN